MSNQQPIIIQTTNGEPTLAIPVSKVHSNIDQNLIQITEDKLELCLSKYSKYLGKTQAWQAPIVLLITIIGVLATTNFKEAAGVSSDVWQAFFMMALVLSIAWLFKAIYDIFQLKSIDIVKQIKKQSEPGENGSQNKSKPRKKEKKGSWGTFKSPE